MGRKALKAALLFLVAFCVVALGPGLALAWGEKDAAKAFFDVRGGDPKSAALHIGLIHQTWKDMAEGAKEKPSFVVVFIGPSVKLISKNTEGFSDEEKKSLAELASTVAMMSKDGIRFEVCLVAARVMGVDPASVLPEVKNVENGWISEIEYQSRGYSLVPVY